MIDYPVCPRCNSEWTSDTNRPNNHIDIDDFLICLNCQMRYQTNFKALKLDNFIGNKGYHLFWWIDSHICEYASIGNRIDHKVIKLPWLPLDITPEKFKLYLLFL